MGRSRPAGHLHERGRERHADGAAGRSRGQAARGLRREGDGGAARRTAEARAGRARAASVEARKRIPARGRRTGTSIWRQTTRSRGSSSIRRAGRFRRSPLRRGSARLDASGGSQGSRSRRFVDGSQPVRSLHLAGPAGLDDADDLRQRLRHHAGPGLRRDPVRDDSRGARHPGGQRSASSGRP